MLQSAVSLHVVAEFFDVCALYLPEMKKRFWASGCNWRHVLEIESKILRTHVFSQCRIGNEK
jgi:hypothetical protein